MTEVCVEELAASVYRVELTTPSPVEFRGLTQTLWPVPFTA
jgi:hypothetical protein